ncbi:Ku protein [Geobacter sp.]|uniref:non-homologous end joining protein Ku n=1 Tax=Geobacter sp. TaxID=46610 RepID=UPI0026155B3B|nr:Ku protein [Geobacter sp.]
MAGTTIWKGTIHFGETSVPVKLHAAVKEERIQFHLLHRGDLVRLHQLMICAYEKKPVPVEAQTRGFEVEEGKYLLVDPEELEQTVPEGSRLIEVHEFVPAGQLLPLFLDHVYYLEPDTVLGGYNELVEALTELDVAGVCGWTMRKRSYLGALQARDRVLRLTTLRYADELVSVSALGLQEIPVTDKELEIGSELISRLTAPFQPEKFVNEHQQKLQALIEKKARGEKIALLRPRLLEPTAPEQLLEALEASLKKVA